MTEMPDGNYVLFESENIPSPESLEKDKTISSSLTLVSNLLTKSCQSANHHNKELNKELTEKEQMENTKVGVIGNYQEGNSSRHLVPKVSTKNPLLDQRDFKNALLTQLKKRKLYTPFEHEDWEVASLFLFDLGANVDDVLNCVYWLKTDPSQSWRTGRITPKIIANNFDEFMRSRKSETEGTDYSNCPDCGGSGIISIDSKNGKICNHERLKTRVDSKKKGYATFR